VRIVGQGVRRATVIVLAFVLLLTGGACRSGSGDEDIDDAERGDPPSQSAGDARRDAVIPAVARMPFAARVGEIESQRTAEGRWVVSRMPSSPGPDFSRGDTGGVYGKDFVATDEYGEILLVDASADRIVRAFPLPGIPPESLLVTDAAVYCIRHGDGALADAMVCRIDRDTFDWKVRVFPPATEPNSFEGRFVPDNWTVDRPVGVLFERLEARPEGGIAIVGSRGTVEVDPRTLAIVGRR
jgi:hypothetical protein